MAWIARSLKLQIISIILILSNFFWGWDNVALFLIILFAVTRVFPWHYFFLIGLILTPVKTIGIIDVGFRMQLNHIFLVSAIAGSFFDKNNRLKWVSGIFDVRIVLFLLVLLFSVFQSRYIPVDPVVILGAFRNYPWIKGLSRVFFVSALVGLAFFIRSYAMTKERFFGLLRILLISSTVYTIIGICGFILYLYGTEYVFGVPLVIQTETELPRIKTLEWEPLFFGGYLLTLTPLMLALMFIPKNGVMARSLLFKLLIINLLGIVLTFSRSVWLGLIISIIILVYSSRHDVFSIIKKLYVDLQPLIFSFVKKNTLAVCIVAYLTVFLFIFFVGMDILQSVNKLFIKPVFDAFDPSTGKFWSTKLRLLTVEIGLKAFSKHPLLGIGFENFNFYSGNIFFYQLLDFAINYPSVENLPLKFLVETGIVGFMFLSVIFISFLVDTWRVIRKTTDAGLKQILKGFVACLFAFFGQSLFVSHFYSAWLWVAVGLFLSAINLATMHSDNKSKSTM